MHTAGTISILLEPCVDPALWHRICTTYNQAADSIDVETAQSRESYYFEPLRRMEAIEENVQSLIRGVGSEINQQVKISLFAELLSGSLTSPKQENRRQFVFPSPSDSIALLQETIYALQSFILQGIGYFGPTRLEESSSVVLLAMQACESRR